ncbi:MAG: hypothetical protein ABH830_02540 [Patescibacteria group bacterium]
MKMKMRKGFTVLEITISLSLFLVAIILVSSMYSLAQRSYTKGSNKGELVQNARVALDRLSREIRQSVDIVTTLPEAADNPLDPPSEEIFFQDGHDISQTTYIRYYLVGTDLIRSIKVYYFTEEPETYVTYDSVDKFGASAKELVLEDKVVGEYFEGLEFWGAAGYVNVAINLTKGQDNFNISTSAYSRN